MIALDTNILVYAHRENSPFHEAAFRRVAELAEGPAVWAIPWPCLHEFLAIVTHARIYAPPTPLTRAVDQVDAWLEFADLDAADGVAGALDYLARAARCRPGDRRAGS